MIFVRSFKKKKKKKKEKRKKKEEIIQTFKTAQNEVAFGSGFKWVMETKQKNDKNRKVKPREK